MLPIQELREDNSILLETKNVLEDQLSTLQARLDGLADLENELLKSRNLVQELHKVREKWYWKKFITQLIHMRPSPHSQPPLHTLEDVWYQLAENGRLILAWHSAFVFPREYNRIRGICSAYMYH